MKMITHCPECGSTFVEIESDVVGFYVVFFVECYECRYIGSVVRSIWEIDIDEWEG